MPTAAAPATAHTPLCPRCGYDLRGQAPTTPAAAPDTTTDTTTGTTTGTCAECGLTFPWREVLDPELASPRWFIESRAGSWRLIRTFLRAVIPPRFFAEVQGVRLTTLGRLWPRIRFVAGIVALLLVVAWLMPVGIAVARDQLVTRPWSSVSEYMVLWPLGPTLGGWVEDLYRDWQARRGAGVWRSPIAFQYSRQYAYLFWLLLLWTLLTPLGLLTLRATRRICRITGTHIARSAVYSLAGASMIIAIGMGLAATGFMIGIIDSAEFPPYSVRAAWWMWVVWYAAEYCLLILPLLGLWLFWWWRTAIHRYMKMPSATGIAAAIVTMGFLAAAVVLTTLAAPGPAQELGERLEVWLR